jgi:hypothetical protein
MKTQVQVRRYENLSQIDTDLRLIESQVQNHFTALSSITSQSEKSCRKFIRTSEFASVAATSLLNIKTWIDHAGLPEEGPKNLPPKIAALSQKISKLEAQVLKTSETLCEPSKELRAMAARLKVRCDSYLTEIFNKATSKAMVLANRATNEFEPVIQIEYWKPVKETAFQFPRYIIRVHEKDGKLSLSTTCIGSLIATASPSPVPDVDAALIFLHARLVAQGLITPAGTKE